MKKLILFSTMSLVGISAFALPDYDPFADASGSGGTTYTVGSGLIGQTNAQGLTWFQAGPAGTHITIASGNLSVAGLVPSSGNMVQSASVNGNAARLGLGGSAITTGTTYYSMAVDITSAGGMTTGGAIIAAFNNSTGSQSGNPTVLGGALEVRSSGTGYNLGIVKQSGQTVVWDSTVHNFGDTVFVVGSYTFGSGNSASLWLNPSSTTFAAGSAPTATLTTAAGADISGIASILIRGATTLDPNFEVDELRVGGDWADVTPVPEPTAVALGGLGIVALIAARRFVRK